MRGAQIFKQGTCLQKHLNLFEIKPSFSEVQALLYRCLPAGEQEPAAPACRAVLCHSAQATCLHTAPFLQARNTAREDFWLPPDPSLPELIFKASETHEESQQTEIINTVKRRLPDASLEDVVAITEAAAAAGLHDKALMDAACSELIKDAGELKPEQLMAASMALAKLGHFSTDWKNVVSDQVKAKLGSFRPAMLAALVRAFGLAGYVDGPFYNMVSEYVEQNLSHLGPQHLADIAFGASAAGCVTERMQNAAEKVALDFVQNADMRSLAFFMEAYTSLGCFDATVSERAASRCTEQMKGTDSASLVRLMKALAKLGQDDEQLFGSIGRELQTRGVHLLSHQDVTSVVSIFSGLMIYNQELMNAIVQQIIEHPQAFAEDLHKIQECCNSLGHYSGDLSKAVEEHGNPVTAGFQTA